MSTSSEDVLLQVPEVRYKKGDGTLYLMDQRLIWMVEHRETVAVSHLYADIKSQKISPEGKAKVQLQVVLHNGVSSTFHFINKNGMPAQVQDRDKVKDMLQTLLPRFKRQVDRELEEKNKLLSSNPTLLQMYKDLVMTEVVTSEEFWTEHASKYTKKQQQQPQEIGVSGAFLADIKPQTDGCNGLKYNITPDIIECIFKTYPAVKKKYVENVPTKMNEAQFWTKFFQSHYFHRDRKYVESKDLFTDCGRIDDQEMRKDIQRGVEDPLVNLTEFEDNTLDECYGSGVKCGSGSVGSTLSASATPSDRGQSGAGGGGAVGGGTVSQAMIKRFNQHSIMVLKASTSAGTSTATRQNGDIQQKTDVSNVPSATKRQKIQSKITYEDLEDTSATNQSGKQAPKLQLSKIERYLHGPMPSSSSTSQNANAMSCSNATSSNVSANNHCNAQVLSTYEAEDILKSVWQEASSWSSAGRHSGGSLVSPAAAVGALGELSPGGALMRGFQEQSLAQLVPADIENEMRNLYTSLCELLHHFWRCFPPTTTLLEQKVIKMHEALHRFHTVKLQPFEDKLIRELSPLSHQLTKHLNQLLNAAYQKFSNWQKVKHR